MKKLTVVLGTLMASHPVLAQEAFTMTEKSWKYLAYFLGMGLAVYGGTAAQSGAAQRALEGIARNPAAGDKLFVPMLLGLALMESLVIFMLISTYLLA